MKSLVIFALTLCTAPSLLAALATLRNSDCDLAVSGNWKNWSGNNGISLTIGGHYTMSSDMSVHGVITDNTTPDIDFYFDLDDDRVLTALGDLRHAFGSNGGVRSHFWVTGGTFLVPETYWYENAGTSRANNYATISPQRQSVASSGLSKGTNVVFGVFNRMGDAKRTKNAKVMTPMIRVGNGYDNWFVASNNAEVVVGMIDIGKYETGVGNGIVVDSGARLTVTNQSELLIGESTTSTYNAFIVSDGGHVVGFDHFRLIGTGNRITFSGVGTDVSLPSSGKSLIEGVKCRLEVLDGAKLSLGTVAQSRIWMGTGSAHQENIIMVSGEGSSLTALGGNFLVSASTPGAINNGIHVKDGAVFKCSSLRIGHGGSAEYHARDNWLRVENGGVVEDAADTIIGNGDMGQYTVGGVRDQHYRFVDSSRLDVVGGILTNRGFVVGCNTNAWDCAAVFDGGQMYTDGKVYVTKTGRNASIVMKNGSKIKTTGAFQTGDGGSSWSGEGAHVEVLSGSSLDVGGSMVFCGTNTSLVVSNAQIDVAMDIQLPYLNAPDGNCAITIAGTNPCIRAKSSYAADAYAIGVRRDATLKFCVPKGGYAEAPLQTTDGQLGLFNVISECPMEFDLSECGTSDQFTTVLAEAKGEGSLVLGDVGHGGESAYLQMCAARIPTDANGNPLAKLYRKGNKLMLKVGRPGFVLLFQ